MTDYKEKYLSFQKSHFFYFWTQISKFTDLDIISLIFYCMCSHTKYLSAHFLISRKNKGDAVEESLPTAVRGRGQGADWPRQG
jgi:hypothetical protein